MDKLIYRLCVKFLLRKDRVWICQETFQKNISQNLSIETISNTRSQYTTIFVDKERKRVQPNSRLARVVSGHNGGSRQSKELPSPRRRIELRRILWTSYRLRLQAVYVRWQGKLLSIRSLEGVRYRKAYAELALMELGRLLRDHIWIQLNSSLYQWNRNIINKMITNEDSRVSRDTEAFSKKNSNLSKIFWRKDSQQFY